MGFGKCIYILVINVLCSSLAWKFPAFKPPWTTHYTTGIVSSNLDVVHFRSPLLSKLQSRNDTFVEKAAIFSLGLLLSQITVNPSISRKELGFDYSNFVTISKLLLLERSPDEIKTVIVNLLVKILPRQIRDAFRSKYQEDPRWVCESSVQWFGFGFLEWLIGPTDPVVSTMFSSKNNQSEEWVSTVKLLECRYLVQSGCKASCLHLCKTPTQTLFAEEMGVPLYMKPNFTDYSCEFMFGVVAPPKDQDEAFTESCFSQCTISRIAPFSSPRKELDVKIRASNSTYLAKCTHLY